MNKKNFIFSIATGLLFANGVFAGDLPTEKDEQIVKSVTYIEDESQIELGFDTADYLPEGFNPYKIYVNLDAIIFLEDEIGEEANFKKHLPANFDAYAYPNDVAAFNYIDEDDVVTMDFDTEAYLPSGFDAYAKTTKDREGVKQEKTAK